MPNERRSVIWAMAPRWKPSDMSLPLSCTSAKSVPYATPRLAKVTPGAASCSARSTRCFSSTSEVVMSNPRPKLSRLLALKPNVGWK